MRLAITLVSLACILTASTQALVVPHVESAPIAQRDESSNLAARDYVDADNGLVKRQLLKIAHMALEGGEALGHLFGHHHRHRQDLLEPRDNADQLERRHHHDDGASQDSYAGYHQRREYDSGY